RDPRSARTWVRVSAPAPPPKAAEARDEPEVLPHFPCVAYGSCHHAGDIPRIRFVHSVGDGARTPPLVPNIWHVGRERDRCPRGPRVEDGLTSRFMTRITAAALYRATRSFWPSL